MKPHASFQLVCAAVAAVLVTYFASSSPATPITIRTREFWADPVVHSDPLVVPDSQNPSKVRIVPEGTTTPQPAFITTQVAIPGDVHQFSGTGVVVLCGTKETSPSSYMGVVTVLKPDAQGVYQTVAPDYTLSGGVFVGIAYSPQTSTLYLLDAANKRIVRASYTAGDAPPTVWIPVIHHAQFAPLADVAKYTLALLADGAEPTLELARYWSPRHNAVEDILGGDRHTIQLKTTGPVAASFAPRGAEMRAGITADQLLSGTTTIEVGGPPNAEVDIVRVDSGDEVIGSAAFGPSGGVVSVIIPPVVMGGIYVARLPSVGAKSPPYLAGMKICGTNDPLTMGSTFAEWDGGIGLDTHVGNANFSLGLLVTVDPNQVVVGTTYPAALLLGSAAHIVTVDGKKILLGNVLLTDVVFSETNFPGVLVQDLPIPLDPNLANTEFYAQYVVDVGSGDLRYSRIGGFLVRATPFVPPGKEDLFPEDVALVASSAKAAGGALRVLAASPRRWDGGTHKAWVKWMQGLKAQPLGPGGTTTLARLLRKQ